MLTLPGSRSLGLPEPGVYLVSVVDRLTHSPGTGAGAQRPGCYFQLGSGPRLWFSTTEPGREVTGRPPSWGGHRRDMGRSSS